MVFLTTGTGRPERYYGILPPHWRHPQKVVRQMSAFALSPPARASLRHPFLTSRRHGRLYRHGDTGFVCAGAAFRFILGDNVEEIKAPLLTVRRR